MFNYNSIASKLLFTSFDNSLKIIFGGETLNCSQSFYDHFVVEFERVPNHLELGHFHHHPWQHPQRDQLYRGLLCWTYNFLRVFLGLKLTGT